MGQQVNKIMLRVYFDKLLLNIFLLVAWVLIVFAYPVSLALFILAKSCKATPLTYGQFTRNWFTTTDTKGKL